MSDTEGSNIESPHSRMESPYSSPSQQVPQLAYSMNGLRCTDKFMHPENGRCYLRIVEEPQNHFRFRYRSEMVGTHGCLLGESSGTSKAKTHPTVELVNYTGKAIIRCRLTQEKTAEEHPHKLLEEEQDKDVSYEVPEYGSYKVGFAGMGIIHTAKKDVASLLFNKYSEKLNGQFNQKELRIHCENEAKDINLNIVRLRFSAHDVLTDKEICPAVFSKPIHNLKSAATNDLKITRISRSCGRATGNEEVFLLVEKVNKKNIRVRVYELNDAGEEIWSSTGHFLQGDVHHQYAIVFSTPPYKDPNTTVDKKVFIELLRPTDGRTSEPKAFTYKALSTFRGLGKRKKSCSSYSSIGSSGGSLRSNEDIPATVLSMIQNSNGHPEVPLNDVQMSTIPQIPIIPQASPSSSSDLGEAILYGMRAEGSPSDRAYASPMLPQGVADPPDLQLNSAEFERILGDNPRIPADERESFCRADWSEYLKSYTDSLNDENNTSYGIEIMRSMLIADSGRGIKQEETTASKPMKIPPKEEKPSTSVENNVVTKGAPEYTAFYKAEDGAEVKKLVKELCEMIRDKTGVKKQIVRAKLERLFEMRLSNRDTFLHMTLCSKQPSLDYIVKLIHSMRMTHLLNLTNDQSQTILHLAIVLDMAGIVPFLISKGCNPMIEDHEGNNAIHYAVMYENCLEPLLDAIKTYKVEHDLDAPNNEKQTPLHLAVSLGNDEALPVLLQRRCSTAARDAAGRTPLHLAARDLRRQAAVQLLHAQCNVDAVDERGYTALQIACDGEVRDGTVELVQLLLENNADPLSRSDSTPSAWSLARHKPTVRAALLAAMPPHALLDDDVKSEPEDDFESADEGETQTGLANLSQYISAAGAELDKGAWATLGAHVGAQPPSDRHSAGASPGVSLLLHLKELGVTTEDLVSALENIGQIKIANIVRPYI